MKLIIFTFPDFISGEIEVISELFQNDLEILHLRKPEKSIKEVENFLMKIPYKFHNKIVIHNHFDLLQNFDLKGIHLNEKNRKINKKVKQKYQKIISSSFHSIKEVEDFKNNFFENQFEYFFLSPIFNSISKINYNSNFSENELKIACQKKIIDKKIIALGGMDLDKVSICKGLGFGGIGILGYFWKSFTENKNVCINRNVNIIVKKFFEIRDRSQIINV